jgi:hypothetical protein
MVEEASVGRATTCIGPHWFCLCVSPRDFAKPGLYAVGQPYDQKFFLAIPQLEVLPLGQPHALASEYVEIFVTFKFTFLTSFLIPHSVA